MRFEEFVQLHLVHGLVVHGLELIFGAALEHIWGDLLTVVNAQGYVVGSGRIVNKRKNTGGRVVAATVEQERKPTGGGVVVAGCVAIERSNACGSVAGRRCVARERTSPGGRVVI